MCAKVMKPKRAMCGYKAKVGRSLGRRFSGTRVMGVKRVIEDLNENADKLKIQKKPAIQYDKLGLPRVVGRGSKMAHKKWLEENGYERLN